jgi:maleate isomerase
MSERVSAGRPGGTIVGKLSGRPIAIPDVDAPPMPSLSPPGVIHNGTPAEGFDGLGSSRGYPDVRSFRRKFGLVVPATNTSMEHELWSIILGNQGPGGLQGLGLHTTNVVTPRPQLRTDADLQEYKRQFLSGLSSAVETALLAEPQYMLMGMSLEHILRGLDEVRAPVAAVEASSGLSWATWHDGVQAALNRYAARRIGILTPFDRSGNESAARMFQDLGYEVVATVGFACANALHIAHVPDWAKERAILELLATPGNRLDAVVQCGTNMSLIQVSEKLEPLLGIPVLGINAVIFWYALRENGFDGPLAGAGRLLREH